MGGIPSLNRIEIEGQFVDPIFGIVDGGKLIEGFSMLFWDPKTGVWGPPPAGTPGRVIAEAMPISQGEAWRFMADWQSSKRLGFVEGILERRKH